MFFSAVFNEQNIQKRHVKRFKDIWLYVYTTKKKKKQNMVSTLFNLFYLWRYWLWIYVYVGISPTDLTNFTVRRIVSVLLVWYKVHNTNTHVNQILATTIEWNLMTCEQVPGETAYRYLIKTPTRIYALRDLVSFESSETEQTYWLLIQIDYIHIFKTTEISQDYNDRFDFLQNHLKNF